MITRRPNGYILPILTGICMVTGIASRFAGLYQKMVWHDEELSIIRVA